MTILTPFANECESARIGDLTVENRTDRVSVYGSLDLTRDQDGLRQARRLQELLDAIVHALETDPNLPNTIAPPDEPEDVPNPFQ